MAEMGLDGGEVCAPHQGLDGEGVPVVVQPPAPEFPGIDRAPFPGCRRDLGLGPVGEDLAHWEETVAMSGESRGNRRPRSGRNTINSSAEFQQRCALPPRAALDRAQVDAQVAVPIGENIAALGQQHFGAPAAGPVQEIEWNSARSPS